MAYRLRMPAEIGDWLTELAGSQPEAAAEVGAALLALMAATAIPGRPLVTNPDEPLRGLYPEPDEATDPREALDLLYQHMLEGLQQCRRELADASVSRSRIEAQLGAADLDPGLRAALDRQLAAARGLETAAMNRAQRLQLLVDRFRTSKEAAKATATATETRERIRQYADTLETLPEAVDIEPASGASGARLEQLLADARRLLALVQESKLDSAPPDAGRRAADPDRLAEHTATGRSRSRPETDLLELRADALGSDARILLAEEPTGTLTLLAALDDASAVADHHDAATDQAGRLLEEIRDEGWPIESLDFAGPEALVAHFFPARGPDLAGRTAALAAAISLTGLREPTGMSMAQVAGRAGLSEGEVKLLELQGPRYAQVEVLAAYARAVGGTLRLTVDLDGTEHIVL